MKITIEKCHEINEGHAVAFVDVVLNDMFIVYGCKIVNSNGGKFVSMPSRKGNDGKYYTHCRFKDRTTQDEFSHLVISAYEGNSGESTQKEAKKQDPANIDWQE